MQVTEEQQEAVCGRDNTNWHVSQREAFCKQLWDCFEGKACHASSRNRLMTNPVLDGVLAVQSGIANEREGIRAFKSATGMDVRESGLWRTQSGIMGALPDDLVGSTPVVEVKCPHQERELIIEEAQFCVQMEGEMYSLRKDHLYWHQVQG